MQDRLAQGMPGNQSNFLSHFGGMGGLGSSLAQLFGGLSGNSGKPYQKAMQQYGQYFNPAIAGFQPYQQAGQAALNPFSQALHQMQDPTAYMKNIMASYQQSPFAKQQQQEAMQAANNFGSASGLLGSSALQNAAQQNAANISNQDMQQYFQNAMGINNSYLGGLQNLISGGQGAAGGQAGLYSNLGQLMGEGAFGKQMGQQQDRSNIFGGLFSLLFGR